MPQSQTEQRPEPSALRSRQQWLAVLAKAGAQALEQELRAMPERPSYRFMRRPETGLTLLRGRIGGTGDAFNVGEMTLTRCVVVLEDSNTVGYGYVAGRSARHAELAAVFDALAQRADVAALDAIERLAREQAQRRADGQAAVQPTKVEFFTLLRE